MYCELEFLSGKLEFAYVTYNQACPLSFNRRETPSLLQMAFGPCLLLNVQSQYHCPSASKAFFIVHFNIQNTLYLFNLLNNLSLLFITFRQETPPYTAVACLHRPSAILFSYPIIPGNNESASLLLKLCTVPVIQKCSRTPHCHQTDR